MALLWIATEDYVQDRFVNFRRRFKLEEFITHLIEGILVFIFMAPGKFSLMSPYITAVQPTLWGFFLIPMQFFFNLLGNRWFAHGNVFLMAMQWWTCIQYFSMFLLVWN